MKEQTENKPVNLVFIVTCYQNILGVYSSIQDANQAASDLINKGRPADVLSRIVIHPLKSN